MVGTFSFVAAKSTDETYGSHFGLMGSMLGAVNFLGTIEAQNTYCTWIVIVLSILFLSLGNPEDEEAMIEQVGDEG